MIDYLAPLPHDRWIQRCPRRVSLLGSTGSIGENALRVIAAHPQYLTVVALAGGRNVRRLAEQALQWRPLWLAVIDADTAQTLKVSLPDDYKPNIVYGEEGFAQLATLPEADTVLSAQVGAAGLFGTLAAAVAGKVICLANKESLVLAADLLQKTCRASGASLLPVDSEHNAVFQALYRREQDVKQIVLTASGGPFRGYTRQQLASVTKAQALKHPNWTMGAKITVDSATLMNKGLEVIEACRLYGVEREQVAVWVHPQSLVHALVEFSDGSLMAHLGAPDMRMPIAQCLTWPHCLDSGVQTLDLKSVSALTFEEPDLSSFSCLALAYRALAEGTQSCVVLNAANEVAVEAFLTERIGFLDIATLIEQTLNQLPRLNQQQAEMSRTMSAIAEHDVPACLQNNPLASGAFMELKTITALDQAAREYVLTLL